MTSKWRNSISYSAYDAPATKQRTRPSRASAAAWFLFWHRRGFSRSGEARIGCASQASLRVESYPRFAVGGGFVVGGCVGSRAATAPCFYATRPVGGRWCMNQALHSIAVKFQGPQSTASASLCMKSKVHPKFKAKYRVGNWSNYDQSLAKRGDITLWISAGAIDAWIPSASGRRGGQRKFSDHAIETALTLRLVFQLPLRQTEGFLRSVLALMGVDVDAPDHTTLSRRSQHLEIELRSRLVAGPIHLIV